MTAPFALPDLADTFRPFGSTTQIIDDLECRIVPNIYWGEEAGDSGGELRWSHYLDCNPGADIRDACTRSTGNNVWNYFDGDRVEATLNGLLHKFVVVWVEQRYTGTANAYTRVYLMRDTVTW